MPTFEDTTGKSWPIEFDGLLLDDVFKGTGVDLADLSAGGLAAVENDAKKLVEVLVILCAPDNPREFSKVVVREAITAAQEAIVSAAANFFPPKQWSEIQSRLKQQREFDQQWAELRPLISKLNAPDMPVAMKDAVMGALSEAMTAMTPDTTSEPSTTEPTSAIGPDSTPLTPAPSLLASVG